MKRRPTILVMPSTESKGVEFADASVSLSNRYTDAIVAAGGLPQIFAGTTNREVIHESIRRADAVLLSGGDDIDPKWYGVELSGPLADKMGPIEPERDVWERDVVEEALEQRKPVLGICRGLQILNVALGGTLIVDIPTQLPNTLNHKQMDKKGEKVHDISVTPGSLLAKLTGSQTLGVNSTHHQSIGKVAELLRVTGQSADGVIEAVELKDPARMPFLLAVQFHPERLIDRDRAFARLFEGFVDAAAHGHGNEL